MKYIRSCESCYREIRFPIDKGVLFITCPYCKHTFKINPDDPQTYQLGRFDIIQKINSNQEYPEEFFFHQQKQSSHSPLNANRILKIIILSLLFFLLSSHIYKIANTPTWKEPIQDIRDPLDEKISPQPNYEI
jgi:hypothetical protein